jgi:hypothetical protein
MTGFGGLFNTGGNETSNPTTTTSNTTDSGNATGSNNSLNGVEGGANSDLTEANTDTEVSPTINTAGGAVTIALDSDNRSSPSGDGSQAGDGFGSGGSSGATQAALSNAGVGPQLAASGLENPTSNLEKYLIFGGIGLLAFIVLVVVIKR